ncbi:MAG: hypothetical protein HGN29_06315 [Asgard group archaeon]|nr:hypothetical protein [Asgard group archaeon]
MKKKVLYSILIVSTLLVSSSLTSVSGVVLTLQWHSSLTIDTQISWRITDMYLVNPSVDNFTLGGHELREGSTVSYRINDTIPTDYDSVYNAGGPPNFLQLFVDYDEVPFKNITHEEPNFALQFLILPEVFRIDSLPYTIEEFLDYRASEDVNITSAVTIDQGDYIKTSIYSSYLDEVTITVNNDTGIVKEIYILDNLKYFTAELNIWESSIDDYGVTIVNTFDWYSSLVSGIILSWEFTMFNLYDPANYMEIGGHNASLGDIFKLKFVADLPTNPPDYYGPELTFWEMYFKNELQPWEDFNRGGMIIFQSMVNPLGITAYNGTYFTTEAIHYVRDVMDEGISDVTISYSGDYMNLHMHIEYSEWRDEHENYVIMDVDIAINIVSGIALTVDYEIPNFGEFQLTLNEDESSVNEYGEINTDFTENTENSDDPTWSLPGYRAFIAFIALLIAIPIYRKKR